MPSDGRRALRIDPADVVDVLVYVVVLNLAIEYVPEVISEGFTLSLLTASCSSCLELVVLVKGRVVGRFHAARTRRGRIVAATALWLVAVGSKFAVLELVDLVFGDSVQLGGFVSVTLLIVALLVSRTLVRRLLFPDQATSTI